MNKQEKVLKIALKSTETLKEAENLLDTLTSRSSKLRFETTKIERELRNKIAVTAL